MAKMNTSPEKPKTEYKWEKERVRDRQPVRGIFRFFEVRGGTLRGSFIKYKGDPLDLFNMKDGETYTIPLGLAVHLRESGYYPVHSYAMNEEGIPMKTIGQKIKRYTFEPLDFIADERMNSSQREKEIVTVATI